MKLFLFIPTLVLIAACGSSSKNQLSSEVDREEYAWIKNTDFVAPKELPFDIRQDKFLFSKEPDSLSSESLNRVSNNELRRLSQSKDPISQVVALCYQREYEKAFKVLDVLYPKFKSNPSYWNQVGTCYLLKGESRKALLYYNKSRDLDTKYAPPVNNLGVLYLREGKEQKALAAFEKSGQLNTFALTPQFNLGQLYLRYGFVRQAKRVFTTLYKKNSEDHDVVIALANVFLQEGNFQQCLSLFESLPDNLRERADVGVNLALALKLSGRPQDARTVLEDLNSVSSRTLGRYVRSVKEFVGGM